MFTKIFDKIKKRSLSMKPEDTSLYGFYFSICLRNCLLLAKNSKHLLVAKKVKFYIMVQFPLNVSINFLFFTFIVLL